MRGVTEKLENTLMQMIEAELTYTQTSDIVNQVVEELDLQANPAMETKEFLEAVDSITELTCRRIGEYKETLTDDILTSHPMFIKMKTELEALVNQPDPDNADEDTEVEPEEVNLEDSQMGESDHLMNIPALDPISKQPLKDPIRNRICNHIYGKASMLALIKTNSKTR